MPRWDLPCFLNSSWLRLAKPSAGDDARSRRYSTAYSSPYYYSNVPSASHRLSPRFSARDRTGSSRPSSGSYRPERGQDYYAYASLDSSLRHSQPASRHRYDRAAYFGGRSPVYTSVCESYMDYSKPPCRSSSPVDRQTSTDRKRSTPRVHWDESTIRSGGDTESTRERHHDNRGDVGGREHRHSRCKDRDARGDEDRYVKVTCGRDDDFYRDEMDRRRRKSRETRESREVRYESRY